MSQNNPALEALRKKIAEIEGASSATFDHSQDVANDFYRVQNAVDTSSRSDFLQNEDEAHKRNSKQEDKGEEAAFQKILRLVNHAEQASVLLKKRLVRDGFEEEVAQVAIERACACGLVDDSRYADMLVRSRLMQNKGLNSIKREVEELGIDPYSVDSFCEYESNHDELDEFERAYQFLLRRPPRAKNIRESAYRKLMQKGFSSSIASRVAREYAESNRE